MHRRHRASHLSRTNFETTFQLDAHVNLFSYSIFNPLPVRSNNMDNDSLFPFARHGDILEKLGDREPSTVLEAQAVIENIRVEKGHLDDATLRDLRTIPERSCQKVMRVVERNRKTEAKYTKSISEQLYSSKYRFLYELVQNADDSLYTNAREQLNLPFLRFRVTAQKFIVETNEDGFTRANVEAICATGESSKKASALDDHIGEKGFGFKSVFSIADEVHIQSGLWSFRFLHRRGDDGLGMVTPLDATAEALPGGVTTRMTLTLSKTARKDHKRLLDAISDLPDTTIFFLQRLSRLEIHVIEADSMVRKTVIAKFPGIFGASPSIQRTFEQSGAEASRKLEESKYHVFSYTVDSMPEHERREGRSQAKIDLAFPVTSDGQPKLSDVGQHAFAYLPVQRVSQLQFLIQSDFITSASRESVVDCAWNDAILDGVARAFANAIAAFANPIHPLRYSWLDFLPTKPMEGLWKNLYPSIKTLLQDMPILQTWERRQFKRPSQLRRLISTYLYGNNPLFRDLNDEKYLAPEYASKHHSALEDLGTRICSWDNLLDRVSADLVRSDSFIKTRAQGDAWHEAYAKLFLKAFRRDSRYWTSRINKLAIIPLYSTLSWTGSPGINPGGVPHIYFPNTEGIDIPDDISLHLVDKVAASNASRKALFQKMGVENCPKKTVLAQIEAAQKSSAHLRWRSHSRYLFHFHPSPELLTSWFRAYTTVGLVRIDPDFPLFFPSENEYDTQQLLPPQLFNTRIRVAALLNKELVELVPPTIRCQNLSWKEWLRRATGARYHPPLLHSRSLFLPRLSPVISATLEHCPEKFVGLLKAHWVEYKADLPRAKSQLMQCKVPCGGAVSELCETYLPTVEIVEELRSLGVESDFPLLLKLPSHDDGNVQQEWRFLEELGVRSIIDLKFYEIVLAEMRASKYTKKESVTKVYKGMAKIATLPDQNQLRSFFKDNESIAVTVSGNALEWCSSTFCVWNGPKFLTVKKPLVQYYGGEEHLETFFSNHIGVRDYSVEDIICELDMRRICGDDTDSSADEDSDQSDDEDTDWAADEVYQFLESNIGTNNEWYIVRQAFNHQKLVLGADGQWHTLQTCLWNSPFSLSGYLDLSKVYPTLNTFFVNHLKVKNANPTMLIKELSRMATDGEPQVSEIRQRLIDVGGMIARGSIDGSLSDALEKLGEVKFLPKKTSDGELKLVGVDEDFAILDHERFGRAFAEHCILLDFALHEVQILDTIFQHMRLSYRYLSAAVKEVSTVGDAAVQNEDLEGKLQAKAYALYCCATKYKSVKALRGETELFTQLSRVQIYVTDDISTNLVLAFGASQVTVKSDRLTLHHDVCEGQLRLYVPAEERLREKCYRSQLPSFLAAFLGAASSAAFAVSAILRSDPRELDDILLEHDIPHVDWIERPAITVPEPPENRSPPTSTAGEHRAGTDAPSTPSRTSGALLTPESALERDEGRHHTSSDGYNGPSTPTPSGEYVRLAEDVVRSAQRATYRQRRSSTNEVPIHETTPISPLSDYEFDHDTTFGSRDANAFAHDRKIGALGEAYVFEILSNLNLPGFGRDNWQSTIRGELQGHSRYADMANWIGRETADLVYTDRDGSLTRYLRENCTGGFPSGIAANRDFVDQPIEYFLEVKTTTGGCGTRFFMSGSQFQRMESLELAFRTVIDKIYVLFRVYDVASRGRGVKIFVDPCRLRGSCIDFEVGTWHGCVRGAV
ncbi:hypothetical protein K458DRAFT_94472 [Lentithecium fluviatile CBS 122367]|uniref:Protein NO VEIN C-terminal domain-containing protein n=1 Tax=Lentithecium fluviatile CBS 122367 TaxID=1168545 RepID=A0A6G1IQ62_9PLEO|nr:hypothetical protein K458DRAFT_94472 [Lentithecium fluviatile CBS 122367]